jgi:anti-sigma regulatory factor (Ser/Thr protein kinase)
MTRRSNTTPRLSWTLPASFEAIEAFFDEFRRHTEAALAVSHRFTAELLAREAINNAVLHGCGANPAKRVRCTCRLDGLRLFMVVADEGEGFDWRSVWSRRGGALEASGRGVQILRRYATRVRYNSKGNAVAIVKNWN